MSVIDVSLKAAPNEKGHVVCHLTCDGQEAKITFTGTEVIMDVVEPAEQAPPS